MTQPQRLFVFTGSPANTRLVITDALKGEAWLKSYIFSAGPKGPEYGEEFIKNLIREIFRQTYREDTHEQKEFAIDDLTPHFRSITIVHTKPKCGQDLQASWISSTHFARFISIPASFWTGTNAQITLEIQRIARTEKKRTEELNTEYSDNNNRSPLLLPEKNFNDDRVSNAYWNFQTDDRLENFKLIKDTVYQRRLNDLTGFYNPYGHFFAVQSPAKNIQYTTVPRHLALILASHFRFGVRYNPTRQYRIFPKQQPISVYCARAQMSLEVGESNPSVYSNDVFFTPDIRTPANA